MRKGLAKDRAVVTRRCLGALTVGAVSLLGGLGKAMASGPAGSMVLAPANATPFDAEQRRSLARDALVYFPRQSGPVLGRPVNFLPVPQWLQGTEPAVARRDFSLDIVSGLPVYLVAAVDDAGRLDASQVSVSVNGVTVAKPGSLDGNVIGGVSAPSAGGQVRDHAVLDMVFAPPAPGHYVVEVRTQFPAGTDDPSTTTRIRKALATSGATSTTVTYDLNVTPPDAFAPLFLRDAEGTYWAVSGGARRAIPDEATLRILSTPAHVTLPASPDFLSLLPVGERIPPLSEGALIRGTGTALNYRITAGERVWISESDVDGTTVRIVDVETVQSIPLALRDHLLVRTSSAPDVYHVDGMALRKVPDWKWVTDHRLRPADIHTVAEWLVPLLAQGAPEWRLPASTWQDRTFFSRTLGRTMPCRVSLPRGYSAGSSARYPVIYLLHGLSGRYDEWNGYGIDEVASGLEHDGKLGGVILVAPQGGLGYWMDQEGAGATPWATYVARDMVQHIDDTYRTVATPAGRAIGGLSMGGHGAVQIALNFPDVFTIAGAHSPSIRSRESSPAFFGTGGAFERRDPISLAKSVDVTKQQFWIDAGQDDSWRSGAEALRDALLERGRSVEFHVFDGGHDGWYWGDHLWEYLPFYASAFARNGVTLPR